MKQFSNVMPLLIAVLLTACGGAEKEEEDRETVFDPLVGTIDRAEEVNDLALEQKDRMDDALRQMEGEEDDPEC